MTSEYDNGPMGDRVRGDHPHPYPNPNPHPHHHHPHPHSHPHPNDYPAPDPAYPGERTWQIQNGGHRTPESGHRLKAKTSGSSVGGVPPGNWDLESRKSGERNRSRQRNGRTASGQLRTCKKCGETLTGQFVRALDGTFHLDCFKCRDCGDIVASKFFPVDDENGEGQYPLCETDYFRRLGLLCYQCGGALRGSYITALDRKYHVDHFTCSLCDTVFGAQDSYYEHDGNVYCHYHYSTQFAQRCNGCQIAILKQFVEIFRNGQNQHWHPECYMIHKFWNVRLAQPSEATPMSTETADKESRDLIRQVEECMEEKVYRIWSVLSTFEESSAACISDMLLHVSNGAYIDGVLIAKRFIWHVEILFQSADRLDVTMVGLSEKGMAYGREAKLLCKKIVSFFSLLSKNQDTGARKLGVTQELLSLVTGLAHYLKLLIRICLQGALRLEREASSSEGLYQFLDDLNDFETSKSDEGALQVTEGGLRLAAKDSDHCISCHRSVEDECAKNGDLRWHVTCLSCTSCRRDLSIQEALVSAYDGRIYCLNCVGSKTDGTSPCEHISKLQQYVFLLRVALARLLDILRNNGTLPPSSNDIQSDADRSLTGPSRLPTEGRSKTYADVVAKDNRRESSYADSMNEVKRLRSTRLDRHLSSARQPRTSRVMEADGRGLRPGSSGGEFDPRSQGSTDAMFGHNDAITLDDIPRIVAVEQSREQQERDRNMHRIPEADTSFDSGHQRTHSSGKEYDARGTEMMPRSINRKFFSELSGLEYFNVRHVAVLTMQPMVETEFTLDELIGLIESKKQPTFWKNLGTAFKKDKTKVVKKKGVFGVPLEIIIERDGADSTDGVGPGTLRIPAVIDDIITSMRKMDLSVEGVFRKNGNIKKNNEMVARIDNEGSDTINFMDQPVVQLAALLKRYLRDMPDPLMTNKLYKLWITAAKITDPEKRKQCLHLTCCLLPKSHRDCLEIIFSFLKWAGSFHQLDEELGSKMDVRNLATVIAPNLLYNPAKPAALDGEAIYVIDAVEMMISNVEEMCQVPDEVLTLLSDPHIFNNTGELTTKEILKRFQERRGQISIADVNEVYNRPDNSTRPPPRRVETDPAVWQGETSVRHVQEPPGVPYTSNSNTPHGTPPQQRWRGATEPGPYSSQFNHSDSQLESSEHSQRRDWRNSASAWNRHPNGGLGVSGNS